MVGVAQFLAAGGPFTWQASGAYADNAVLPIFLRNMPDTPDRCVVLGSYVVQENAGDDSILMGVQVRCRGARKAPTDHDAIADLVRGRLHGQQWPALGVLTTNLIWRQSHGQLGTDTNTRSECSSNYYGWFAQPSSALPD